jgi:ABC-type multidrug transport system ATPase subunit
VPALLDAVGLDAKARKRKLREYSKGMARRIGLAQALINDPELILLDEPTTGLDPIGTREMKDLIKSLREQGKTVLLCSHLLADVQDVCDRITILFRGKMHDAGAGARFVAGARRDADADTDNDAGQLEDDADLPGQGGDDGRGHHSSHDDAGGFVLADREGKHAGGPFVGRIGVNSETGSRKPDTRNQLWPILWPT